MFECFYPDEYLDSIESIDFQKLYEQACAACSLTLIIPWFHTEHWRMPMRCAFEKLRKIGTGTALISNNQPPR